MLLANQSSMMMTVKSCSQTTGVRHRVWSDCNK